jgi:hypothetical protein
VENEMGELLYFRFMEECIEDLQTAMIHNGVEGILSEFERWLAEKGYTKSEHGQYVKHQ